MHANTAHSRKKKRAVAYTQAFAHMLVYALATNVPKNRSDRSTLHIKKVVVCACRTMANARKHRAQPQKKTSRAIFKCLHTNTCEGYANIPIKEIWGSEQSITCKKTLQHYACCGLRPLQARLGTGMHFNATNTILRNQKDMCMVVILQSTFLMWEQGRQSYAMCKIAAFCRFRKTRGMLCKWCFDSADTAFSHIYTHGTWSICMPNNRHARCPRHTHMHSTLTSWLRHARLIIATLSQSLYLNSLYLVACKFSF